MRLAMTNVADFSIVGSQEALVPAPREDNKLRIEDRAAHD
jgi:hypothetical protein